MYTKMWKRIKSVKLMPGGGTLSFVNNYII